MESNRWAVVDTRYLDQGLIEQAIEFVITQHRAGPLEMTPREMAQWHADNLNREEGRERWKVIPLPPTSEFDYESNPREVSHSICIECQNKMGRFPSKEKIKKWKEEREKSDLVVVCAWCKRVMYDPDLNDLSRY